MTTITEAFTTTVRKETENAATAFQVEIGSRNETDKQSV